MDNLSPDDRDLLIRTIAGEAGGESPLGQAAVAHVILNRADLGGFGNGVSGVIRAPWQFSMWNDAAHGGNNVGRNLSPQSAQYQRIGALVDGVADGSIPDPTNGATHYYNPAAASPTWGRTMTNVTTIGNHRFGDAGDVGKVPPAVEQANTPSGLPKNYAAIRPPAAALVAAQAPGPIDPSIIARGGTGPPLPADAPTTPTPGTTLTSTAGLFPGFTSQKASNDFLANAQAFDKAMGGSGRIGGGGGEEAQPPQMGPPPMARNVGAQGGPLVDMARQIYGNSLNSIMPPAPSAADTFARMSAPMQWGAQAPGQNPWANVGPQGLGTSLNSLNQWAMLSDPNMQQYYSGGLGGLV